MSYTVNKTNGDILVIVEDGTADLNSTSLAIVGRNFAGYGELFNENFVHVLENFAHTVPPRSPLVGQLWYDTASKLLKVYNGADFISSGGGVESDISSSDVNYFTFVSGSGSIAGITSFKTAGGKGISIRPSTGFVGINKTSQPLSRLEINGGANTGRTLVPPIENTVVHIHGDNSLPASILIDSYGGGNNNTAQITMRRTTSSTSSVQLGNVLGSFNARGWTGSTFSNDSAMIRFVCSQTWSSTATGTKIEFLTTSDFTTTPTVKAIMHQNGDFEVKGDIIGFSLSDERLKEKFDRIENALDKVKQLDGVTFNWNNKAPGKDLEVREVGLKAAQVKHVQPEAVGERTDGFLAVKYEKLVPLLVEAIKEIAQEIDAIKKFRTA